MKVLDFNKIRTICNDIDPVEYYEWVNYTFKNKKDFDMPEKSKMSQCNGDYFHSMPCLLESENIAMLKMIGRHELKGNETRPVMMGDLMLYEANTGKLKALMDAEYITTLRTGAAAAQAAIMFGKKDFSVIGLIGLGNIMTVCAQVLFGCIDNRNLVVKLYKHHNQEERFIGRFKDKNNVKFVLCDSYEEVIKGSDVIISAVTRVTENFCKDECFDEGCTVIPIMTMGFQNCDLFFDKVFTDEIEQIKGFKYFDKFKSLNNCTDVINGCVLGRDNDKQRILVYYYGLAIHDLYFASKILNLSKGENDIEYNFAEEKYFV